MSATDIKGLRSNAVLILGASPRISVPIARSLHLHGIPVEIASFQPEEPDIRARAVRAFHRLPARHNPDALASALLALVSQGTFDLILPAGDPALATLANLYNELSPLLRLGCPSPFSIERVLNKSLTLEIAQRCGIRVPFTCTISNSSEIESIAPRLRFPVVVKPEKKGASAFRVFYFNTLTELSSALKNHEWGSVLLQEYCPGVGVGVELLMHNGECVAKFQHRRLREAPATGGVAVVAVSEEPDPALLQSSVALLRALEWEGPAMVEFRDEREKGVSTLMEVNGRFWGSVSLPIMAGVNFPLYYWQLLHGEQPRVPARYAVGMKWRWSPGYLERLHSIMSRSTGAVGRKPSRVKELLRAPADFSPLIKEALWSWSDPAPFFAELGLVLKVLLSGALKAAFRRLLPRRLKSRAGIYSRLTPNARPVYVKLCMRDALGLGTTNHRPTPGNVVQKAKSICFVCFGNLMRSPMAEALLRHTLANHRIPGVVAMSAGLHAVPGREPHPWALAASRELGIPLDQHQAQLLTPELIACSDLIFAMDFENLAELEALYPAAQNKIFLLSRYAGKRGHRNREIPDPYFGNLDTTRRCYSLIGECVDNLVREIEAT